MLPRRNVIDCHLFVKAVSRRVSFSTLITPVAGIYFGEYQEEIFKLMGFSRIDKVFGGGIILTLDCRGKMGTHKLRNYFFAVSGNFFEGSHIETNNNKKRASEWADRIGSIAIGIIVVVILASFLSPDVRTMMGFGKGQAQQSGAVSGTTNPSSGTSQTQATTQTEKLNFQHEPAAQRVAGELTYEMIVWVTTDGAMQGFQLRIVCDAACKFQSLDLGSGDLGKDTSSTSNRQINDRTIEVGLNQGFNSSQKCKIVLSGTTLFHISAINRI
jgi:hypothetical protein